MAFMTCEGRNRMSERTLSTPWSLAHVLKYHPTERYVEYVDGLYQFSFSKKTKKKALLRSGVGWEDESLKLEGDMRAVRLWTDHQKRPTQVIRSFNRLTWSSTQELSLFTIPKSEIHVWSSIPSSLPAWARITISRADRGDRETRSWAWSSANRSFLNPSTSISPSSPIPLLSPPHTYRRAKRTYNPSLVPKSRGFHLPPLRPSHLPPSSAAHLPLSHCLDPYQSPSRSSIMVRFSDQPGRTGVLGMYGYLLVQGWWMWARWRALQTVWEP